MKKVAFVVPSPIRGSGGVARIYANAMALQNNGFHVDFYVFDLEEKTKNEIVKNAFKFYQVEIDAQAIRTGEILNGYDLAIATRWDTARLVRDSDALKKAYFIQDFEVYFNQVGDASILAENSYLYGLNTITYGRWLALKLSLEFGCNSYYCDFTTDHTKFNLKVPMKERFNRAPSICFIYQHDKPRRCPQLGIEALGIVKHYRPDIQIYLVGSDTVPEFWFDVNNLGILNSNQLNDLYNKCHVGLCLSSSNPSCNPFDMMASGLPSVELYRENNLYDVPEGAVSLAHQSPESLAEAILDMFKKPSKLEAMSNFGLKFISDRSSDKDAKYFTDAVVKILSGDKNSLNYNALLEQSYSETAIVAQVVNSPNIQIFVNAQKDRFKYLMKSNIILDEVNSLNSIGKLSRKNYSNFVQKKLSHRVKAFLKKIIK